MSRVWLITGGNSGFGRAITEAAVAAGDVVVATARRVTALDDLVAAHPDQVEALLLDVTDAAAIDAAVRDITDRHGRIDVLVNNAGRKAARSCAWRFWPTSPLSEASSSGARA
jgi:NAD(P)-dependent dehydrogenase (short-subunit alcohol dehydrogenase family)